MIQQPQQVSDLVDSVRSNGERRMFAILSAYGFAEGSKRAVDTPAASAGSSETNNRCGSRLCRSDERAERSASAM
jgi:hypothetical protein